MASIITNRKNGTRTIAFYVGSDDRKFIRLGQVSMKQAESTKVYIEDLVACRITGTAPKNTTAAWLACLPDLIRQRIERTGLIGPQERADVPTLAVWLDRYISGRKDVKPRTQINYDQARKSMLAFFGKDKQLDRITHGDCEDFRVWMRTEKNLSEGTTRRQAKRCKQFFAAAVKRKIIGENPFNGIKCSNFAEDRFYFVTRQETTAVLDACPDAEWRLIFALARFGGLRAPSEILLLEWIDVNWEKIRFTVHSPKTEHHDGRGSRVVPIFPELYPHLRDAFEQAEPGQRYVSTRYRDGNANLRTQLTRIIKRAGLRVWPKLFQNLRSTRETELAEAFPIHVVTAWLGNSPEVARKHYLQVTEKHFERAAAAGDGCGRLVTVADGRDDSVSLLSPAGGERNARQNKPLRSSDDGDDDCDGLLPTPQERNGLVLNRDGLTAPLKAHEKAHHQAHQNPLPHVAAPYRTVSQDGCTERRNSRGRVEIRDVLRYAASQCDCTGSSADTPKGTRTPVFRMRT